MAFRIKKIKAKYLYLAKYLIRNENVFLYATFHTQTVGNNLRKPIYILNLLLIILAFSCGQSSSKKQLNGKWFEIDNEYSTWTFYADSLLLKGDSKEKVEWIATESEIEFNIPTFYWDSLGKPIDIEDKITVRYKLSTDKDSLFGTLENRYGVHKFGLLKAENYIEFLHKRYGIKFSLPEDNSVKYLSQSNNHGLNRIYGLKVLIGYSNGKIIGRTELSGNLKHLESDIRIFKDSIKPYEHPRNDTREISKDEHKILLDRRFHLRVFADKNISDSIITKYLSITIRGDTSSFNKYFAMFKSKPPKTIAIKIFRIYNSEEIESYYGIRGRKIKTIANTVYN